MQSMFCFGHAAALAAGISLLGTTATAQSVGGMQVFDKTTGALKTEIAASGGFFYAATEDLQSRIITGGDINSPNTLTNLFVSRYNSNGTADTSFGAGGVTTTGTPAAFWDIGVDSSGRVYVLASSPQTQSAGVLYVVRFQSNGALDKDYNNGNSQVTMPAQCAPGGGALDVDGSGNTAVACDSDTTGGFKVAEFDAFGHEVFLNQLGFTDVNSFTEHVRSVKIDPQGRVLAFGMSKDGRMAVRRFASGHPDPSFGLNNGTVYQSFGHNQQIATDAAIDANGNIFVVGTMWDTPDYSSHFMLFELDAFGGASNQGEFTRGSHFAPVDTYHDYKIALAGGSLFIGGNAFVGHSSRKQFAIFKMSTAFQWDQTFGPGGMVTDFISGHSDGTCYDLSYDPRTKNPVLVGVGN